MGPKGGGGVKTVDGPTKGGGGGKTVASAGKPKGGLGQKADTPRLTSWFQPVTKPEGKPAGQRLDADERAALQQLLLQHAAQMEDFAALESRDVEHAVAQDKGKAMMSLEVRLLSCCSLAACRKEERRCMLFALPARRLTPPPCGLVLPPRCLILSPPSE